MTWTVIIAAASGGVGGLLGHWIVSAARRRVAKRGRTT